MLNIIHIHNFFLIFSIFQAIGFVCKFFQIVTNIPPIYPCVYIFKNFWLCQVLVVANRLQSAWVQQLQCAGLVAPLHVGSQLSSQRSNLHSLHWKADSQPLDHQRNPGKHFLGKNYTYTCKWACSSNHVFQGSTVLEEMTKLSTEEINQGWFKPMGLCPCYWPCCCCC